MNLNEQIFRIKNLMYEQPQVELVYDGNLDDSTGYDIGLKTPDNTTIGNVFLTKLKNAPSLDPSFIKMFDESKFQTIPLNYENSLFLHSLNVNDNFKRQGYGSQLLNQCHNFAKDNGYQYITLVMDKGNQPAQTLYDKLGYQKLNSDDEVDFYFLEL